MSAGQQHGNPHLNQRRGGVHSLGTGKATYTNRLEDVSKLSGVRLLPIGHPGKSSETNQTCVGAVSVLWVVGVMKLLALNSFQACCPCLSQCLTRSRLAVNAMANLDSLALRAMSCGQFTQPQFLRCILDVLTAPCLGSLHNGVVWQGREGGDARARHPRRPAGSNRCLVVDAQCSLHSQQVETAAPFLLALDWAGHCL